MQRTVWDWEDNRQLQTSYANWYGTTYGTPASGRTFRVAGRVWPSLQSATPTHLIAITPRRTDGLTCSNMYYTVNGSASGPCPP